MSSSLDELIIQAIDSVIIIIPGKIVTHSDPPKLPINQKDKFLNSRSELMKVSTAIPTDANALTAIPINSIYDIPC